MKTKYIPSIIMLVAGLIRAIAGVFYRQDIKDFLWSILIVMIIFYIIGSVVKVVLDKQVVVEDEEKEPESEVDIVLGDISEVEDKEKENFEQEPDGGMDFVEKINEFSEKVEDNE